MGKLKPLPEILAVLETPKQKRQSLAEMRANVMLLAARNGWKIRTKES